MIVYVNDAPVDLLPGMSVRHALLRAGLQRKGKRPPVVRDAWGNEVGLDGSLRDGERIYVRPGSPGC